MITISDDLRFHLSNGQISYAFRVSPEGLLEHLHFGGAIPKIEHSATVPRRVFRACSLEYEAQLNYHLEDIPQEYPLWGRSDNRTPALHAINCDGNSTFALLYKSHQVSATKPTLGDLPSAEATGSKTLSVTLEDPVYGLQAVLNYTIYAHHNVITRSVSLHNTGTKPIQLRSVQSTNLDLGTNDLEAIHFSGSWSREFKQERHAVQHGRFVVESSRGTSSNTNNPCLILVEPSTTEFHGKSYSFALLYSGNHSFSVERGEFGSTRISAGINPFNFSWQLEPGQTFYSPEVAQAYSASGLNDMSQIWHSFINQAITPARFRNEARPTYLNSWEACYFDINEAAVAKLVEQAKALELEMLVIDDGWFKGRNDDKSSLGDWHADEQKFPNGILEVAQQVNKAGLKFGLWFEPEMVNEHSDLYAAHPDWIVRVPHQTLSTGRNQYTLDLSNHEVVDYLYERIAKFLSSGQINYVKWDMNRTMSELGSSAWPASQQQEVAHRYILGLYQLLGRITKEFPNVLFENCASGGNRFDLGMLAFMPQGWVSDMSEPIGRLPIFNGASYIYPQSTLAAYIGPVPSHQNARHVSLKTRAEVSFFCAARGVSLSHSDIDANFAEIKQYVALFKQTAQDVVSGQLYRLHYSANEVIWQLTSADQRTLYIGYFHVLSGPNLPLKRVALCQLQHDAKYRLSSPSWEGDTQVLSGAELMHRGLDLPIVDAMQHQKEDVDYRRYMPVGDFTSMLMVLKKS